MTRIIPIICFTVLCALNCSSQKTIEIPLTQKNGYGPFNEGMAPVLLHSENSKNIAGVPSTWENIRYGEMETNTYQSAYQDYQLGKISLEEYNDFQKSVGWHPDTLNLSKEPLKTNIALIVGKDSSGYYKLILDANNNHDFSDDSVQHLLQMNSQDELFDRNSNTTAFSRTTTVNYERLVNNKKTMVSAPVLIAYIKEDNLLWYSFPQYLTGNFNELNLAIRSGPFTSLSYERSDILVFDDSLRNSDVIATDGLINKNEYLEIKGEIYKNLGANLNKNVLLLEKMKLPKKDIYSTQVGYKAFPYVGNDFIAGIPITSDSLKGKYVFLDFWATFCGPCIAEFPNLKSLYEKTSRKNLEIVGIVCESLPEMVKNIINKYAVNWPQILSTDDDSIKKAFGVYGYPKSFLINPEGIVIAKDLRGKELERIFMKLMNK